GDQCSSGSRDCYYGRCFHNFSRVTFQRSGSKSGELIAAGADNVIVVGEEDVRDIIFDITDGLGADLIYDAVGGPGLEALGEASQSAGPLDSKTRALVKLAIAVGA